MPKYLFQASYTQEGLRGLMDEGAAGRREMAEHLDAAVSVAVGASGTASIKTTVLVTPETIDEAVKRVAEERPPRS